MKPISATDAMTLPGLFGPHFAGESWGMWRAVVKAALAEPMTDQELVSFRSVADRDPPKSRVRELVAIVGRGGGKDATAAFLAVLVAINFQAKGTLRPGELGTVAVIACDRDQSQIAFQYIRGMIEETPLIASMIESVGTDTIKLTNRSEIRVMTNSMRAVRGRRLICTILDEVAFFRSDLSANPDAEVYAAVQPSLARTPGSLLILISSAYRKAGLLYDRWAASYGRDDPNCLVVRGTTLQFNPTFDADLIKRDLARDPERYGAEYLSEWRTDISSLLDRDAIEALVDIRCRERQPLSGRGQYLAFADASGGSIDSFCLGIAHREGDRAVLDVLRERRPPFSPEATVAEFAKVLETFGIRKIVSDRYAGEFHRELWRKHGVGFDPSEMTASEIFADFVAMVNSAGCLLLDNDRLVAQLAALERRISRTGREMISHPVGGHDDLAVCAAGALLLAGKTKRTLVISDAALAMSSRGPGNFITF